MNDETCWQCGGEGTWHSCMDDCCPCLEPEDNTTCDECGGSGYLTYDNRHEGGEA